MRFLLILLTTNLIAGCATRCEVQTYVGELAGDPIKRTVIKHSWWLGLPALAPMDMEIIDGEFGVKSASVKLPSFGFDSLFEKN